MMRCLFEYSDSHELEYNGKRKREKSISYTNTVHHAKWPPIYCDLTMLLKYTENVHQINYHKYIF